MNENLGMLIYLVLCVLILLWAGRHRYDHTEPKPQPPLLDGFEVRVHLRYPGSRQDMADFAQNLIDHIHSTFNDDDSIWYCEYDVPEEQPK